MRKSSNRSVVAPRAGRVLVECCVSLVLLSGCSTLMLLLANSTATLVDDARQHDLALREQLRAEAAVLSAPCLAAAGDNRRAVGPRTVVETRSTIAGTLHAVAVQVVWRTSALTSDSIRTARTSTAGWCE